MSGKKWKAPTEAEVKEAFATALIAEDLLRRPLAHFGISEPGKYASMVELMQATIDGVVPRYDPDPMLPGELWSAWSALHNAGAVWDRWDISGRFAPTRVQPAG